MIIQRENRVRAPASVGRTELDAALICDQCGEEWIDDQTAHKLEKVVDEARARRAQIEVTALL